MKTSNKLLLTFFLALIFSSFISMIIARQNMIITKQASLVGNKNVVKKEIAAKLQADTLYLDESYEYFLLPDTEAVSIEAEENIIPVYEVQNDGIFRLGMNNDRNVTTMGGQKFYLGIQNKSTLTIIAKDYAQVSSLGTLNLEDLSIEAEDNSIVQLAVTTDYLSLEAGDHTRIDLAGQASSSDVDIDDNCQFSSPTFTIDSLWINMEDYAKVQLKAATHLKGKMKHNTNLHLQEEYDSNKLRTTDHANVVIGN